MKVIKDEKKEFDEYRTDSEFVIGMKNFINSLEIEPEESKYINGHKIYSGYTRDKVISLIYKMLMSSFSAESKSFDVVLNRAVVNIYMLNYEEASKSTKEMLNLLKHKQANNKNEMFPYIVVLQEIIKHYSQSPSITHSTLNDTVNNILLNTDDLPLNETLSNLFYFIQQKLFQNIKGFIVSREIPILMKFLVIFKYANKYDVFI